MKVYVDCVTDTDTHTYTHDDESHRIQSLRKRITARVWRHHHGHPVMSVMINPEYDGIWRTQYGDDDGADNNDSRRR